MIQAVLFDLDNTLLDRDAAFRRYAEYFYHAHPVVGRTHTLEQAADRLIAFDEGGNRPKEDVFADVLREWPDLHRTVHEMIAAFWARFPSYFALDEPTAHLLRDLSAHGIPYGVVTNGAATQFDKMRASGLDRWVHTVVVSDLIGVAKPDPRIFHEALSRVQQDLQRTLFVGDNPEADIRGAQAVGMRTAWIHRGRDWPYEDQRPDYIVSHVAELRSVLLDGSI